MPTEIVEDDEYTGWLKALPDSMRNQVKALVGLLEEQGVNLGFPYSTKIQGHKKLRELRKSINGDPIRILYAMDRQRRAVLLLGDNKGPTANDWYKVNVPKADKLWAKYKDEQ